MGRFVTDATDLRHRDSEFPDCVPTSLAANQAIADECLPGLKRWYAKVEW